MDKQKLRAEIFARINAHRAEQDAKHGKRNKNITLVEYGNVLSEENGEVIKEINDVHFEGKSIKELKKELIQTATVCVAILEFLDDNPDFHEDAENLELVAEPETAESAIEACAVDAYAESGESLYYFEVDFRYSFKHQNGDWHPAQETRYFNEKFKSDADALAHISQNHEKIFAEFKPTATLSEWKLNNLMRLEVIPLPASLAKFNKCS